MSEFPQYMLVVIAEIDEQVEASWNAWYDEEHLPAALACPGVLRGSRYLCSSVASLTKDGKKSEATTRTYMAVYELSGPEAIESDEFVAMRGWHKFTDNVTSRTQLFSKR